eukprot:SAG11_NODE_10369_length_836_cov_1.533243_2_plen_171_part_01
MVQDQLLDCVTVLASDASQHVKAALAQDLMGMGPLLGRDVTVERLLPVYLQLLREDSSEVRLNVIGGLDVVSSVVGVDQLSQSLLPAVIELAEDKQCVSLRAQSPIVSCSSRSLARVPRPCFMLRQLDGYQMGLRFHFVFFVHVSYTYIHIYIYMCLPMCVFTNMRFGECL